MNRPPTFDAPATLLMRWSEPRQRYEAAGPRREEHLARRAGFYFDPHRRCWYTRDPVVALRLAPRATVETRERLKATQAALQRARAASRSDGKGMASLSLPVPEGRDYMPFQKAGILRVREIFNQKGGDANPSRRGVLLADEMG